MQMRLLVLLVRRLASFVIAVAALQFIQLAALLPLLGRSTPHHHQQQQPPAPTPNPPPLGRLILQYSSYPYTLSYPPLPFIPLVAGESLGGGGTLVTPSWQTMASTVNGVDSTVTLDVRRILQQANGYVNANATTTTTAASYFTSPLTTQQAASSLRLVYLSQPSDQWMPMAGPDSAGFVPTLCGPGADTLPVAQQIAPQANCVGSFGRLHRLLQQCRQDAYTRATSSAASAAGSPGSATTEFLPPGLDSICWAICSGDFMAGSAFGRFAHGAFSADYLYLAGFDAVGVSSTEFQVQLGSNWTIFQQRIAQNFNGQGAVGGIADHWLNLNLSAHPTLPAMLRDVNQVPRSYLQQSGAAGSYQDIGFSTLDPIFPPLPGMSRQVIFDTRLDLDAIHAGLCSVDSSSCSRTLISQLRSNVTILPAAPLTSNLEDRLGLLSISFDNLRAIAPMDQFFEPFMDPSNQAFQDLANEFALLQRDVATLVDQGVNRVVLLATSEVTQTFIRGLQTLSGIDVVITEQVSNYPQYAVAEAADGSPMLFLSCSNYILHYCMTLLQFDANGVLLTATLNSTLLTSAQDYPLPLTTTAARINSDYNLIYLNASSNPIGYKEYPSAFPDSSYGRFFETLEGDMAADSGRWIAGTQVAVQNAGGVRSVMPVGPITLSEVGIVMPFQNLWMSLRLTGNAIRQALENGVSLSTVNNPNDPAYTPAGKGRFLHLSGMRMVWNNLGIANHLLVSVDVLQSSSSNSASFNLDYFNSSNNPQGTASIQQQVWSSLDPDAWYTMAISAFEAAGGDGYYLLGNPEVQLITPSFGTCGIVLQSYVQNFVPLKVSTAERRVVIDTSRWTPVLMAVSPAVAEYTQSNTLLLIGYNLYTSISGSASSGSTSSGNSISTSVTLRTQVLDPLSSTIQQFQFPCTVQSWGLSSYPLNNPIIPAPPLQQVSCQLQSLALPQGASVVATRFFINSGALNGTTSYSANNLFNMTAGSPLTDCLRQSNAVYSDNGGCQCRAGYIPVTIATSAAAGNSTSQTSVTSAYNGCQACKTGSFSKQGDLNCTLCSPGTYSSETGRTSCLLCDSNSYSAFDGAVACKPCPSNSVTDYNLSPIRDRCFCSNGYVNQEDWRRLLERVSGVYVNYTNASSPLPSSRNTTAPPGILPASFINPHSNFTCMQCPFGSVCDAVSGQIESTPGYWLSVATQSFVLCIHPSNCCYFPRSAPTGTLFYDGGGVASSGSCSVYSEVTACDEDREGFICASCKPGFQNQQHSSVGTSDPNRVFVCAPCTKADYGAIMAVILGSAVYIVFITLSVPGEHDFVIRLIDYFQMVGVILLPNTLTAGTFATDILELFHLRTDTLVQSSSNGQGVCILPTTSLDTIILQAVVGFLLFLALLFIGLISAALQWLCRRQDGVARCSCLRIPKWRVVMGLWQLLKLGFIGTISGAFDLVGCRPIGSVEVLAAAPDVQCWTGDHVLVGTVAVIVAITLCIIIPAGLSFFVMRIVKPRLARSWGDYKKLHGGELATAIHKLPPLQRLSIQAGQLASGTKIQPNSAIATRTSAAADLADADVLMMEMMAREIYQKKALPALIAETPCGCCFRDNAKEPAGGAAASPVSLHVNRESAAPELGQFEQLVLSHGVIFLGYRKNFLWFESAFLIRRVVFVLPFSLTTQTNANFLAMWWCILLLLFHSYTRVFTAEETHLLHNTCLFSLISVCLLQSSDFLQTLFPLRTVAWVLVALPLLVTFYAIYSHHKLNAKAARKQRLANKLIDHAEVQDSSPGGESNGLLLSSPLNGTITTNASSEPLSYRQPGMPPWYSRYDSPDSLYEPIPRLVTRQDGDSAGGGGDLSPRAASALAASGFQTFRMYRRNVAHRSPLPTASHQQQQPAGPHHAELSPQSPSEPATVVAPSSSPTHKVAQPSSLTDGDRAPAGTVFHIAPVQLEFDE